MFNAIFTKFERIKNASVESKRTNEEKLIKYTIDDCKKKLILYKNNEKIIEVSIIMNLFRFPPLFKESNRSKEVDSLFIEFTNAKEYFEEVMKIREHMLVIIDEVDKLKTEQLNIIKRKFEAQKQNNENAGAMNNSSINSDLIYSALFGNGTTT